MKFAQEQILLKEATLGAVQAVSPTAAALPVAKTGRHLNGSSISLIWGSRPVVLKGSYTFI